MVMVLVMAIREGRVRVIGKVIVMVMLMDIDMVKPRMRSRPRLHPHHATPTAKRV